MFGHDGQFLQVVSKVQTVLLVPSIMAKML